MFSLNLIAGVVGAVDCTHVRLYGSPMGEEEYVFVNGNIQAICDASYKITNIVARWPGITHDSAILQASVIGDMLENGRYEPTKL